MCLLDRKRIKSTSCYGFSIVEKCFSDKGSFYSGRYYGGKYQLLKSYTARNNGSTIFHTIKNKRNVIKTTYAGFYGYTKYTDALKALKKERSRLTPSVQCNFKIMFCLFEKVFELGIPNTYDFFSDFSEEGRIALRACKRTLLVEMKA